MYFLGATLTVKSESLSIDSDAPPNNCKRMESKMDAQKDKKPRMKNKAILEPSIRSRPARAIHVSTTVGIGNTVYLKSHGYDFKCTLVHPEDAEPDIGLISYDSFVGKKIIGKKVHDMVLITTPFGRFKYRITKIMKK